MKKAAIVAGALLGLWVGLKYLLPISTPFVLGAGLALAAEPGVKFLSGRLRLPRAAAAGIGVGAVFAVICAVPCWWGWRCGSCGCWRAFCPRWS